MTLEEKINYILNQIETNTDLAEAYQFYKEHGLHFYKDEPLIIGNDLTKEVFALYINNLVTIKLTRIRKINDNSLSFDERINQAIEKVIGKARSKKEEIDYIISNNICGKKAIDYYVKKGHDEKFIQSIFDGFLPKTPQEFLEMIDEYLEMDIAHWEPIAKRYGVETKQEAKAAQISSLMSIRKKTEEEIQSNLGQIEDPNVRKKLEDEYEEIQGQEEIATGRRRK